jgi:S1-C subfamily serine protease
MTSNAGAGGTLTALSNELAAAVERSAASTVRVNARRRQSASGIVWTDGVVLTTDHVIERDEDITIGLPDGHEVPATLAGRDPGTDLAVLRTGSTPGAIEQGGIPGVGSIVLAVARPDREGPQATLGVVSAVAGPARTWRGGQLDRFIRSDAILYPGFSGGPLVDSAGRAIGINSSHLAQGSGIAIPVEVAARVVESLLSHGRVRRGYLGISSQTVPLPVDSAAKSAGQESGLLIVRVEPASAAEQGGVIVGDILIAMDGQAVSDVEDLQRLLSGSAVGKAAGLQVLRGGDPRTLNVTIGERQ